jgi:hypothetical protein
MSLALYNKLAQKLTYLYRGLQALFLEQDNPNLLSLPMHSLTFFYNILQAFIPRAG